LAGLLIDLIDYFNIAKTLELLRKRSKLKVEKPETRIACDSHDC
jgi:hypothetical protein